MRQLWYLVIPQQPGQYPRFGALDDRQLGPLAGVLWPTFAAGMVNAACMSVGGAVTYVWESSRPGWRQWSCGQYSL